MRSIRKARAEIVRAEIEEAARTAAYDAEVKSALAEVDRHLQNARVHLDAMTPKPGEWWTITVPGYDVRLDDQFYWHGEWHPVVGLHSWSFWINKGQDLVFPGDSSTYTIKRQVGENGEL